MFILLFFCVNSTCEIIPKNQPKSPSKKINNLQDSFSNLNTNDLIKDTTTKLLSLPSTKSNAITKPLDCCVLPVVGHRFDVKVITASNPSNFVVGLICGFNMCGNCFDFNFYLY